MRSTRFWPTLVSRLGSVPHRYAVTQRSIVHQTSIDTAANLLSPAGPDGTSSYGVQPGRQAELIAVLTITEIDPIDSPVCCLLSHGKEHHRTRREMVQILIVCQKPPAQIALVPICPN